MAEPLEKQTPAGAEEVVVSVRVTDQPWTLPVDAVVLSAGGSLAEAFERKFPHAKLLSSDVGDVSPAEPLAVPLRAASESLGPWLAVITTPHAGGWGPPTVDSIAQATGTAVRAAIESGAVAVAVPMLAAGNLGASTREVAAVVVPAAIAAGRPPLRLLVFFTPHSQEAAILQAAADGELPTPAAIRRFQQSPSTGLAGGMDSDHVDPRVGIPLAEDRLGVAPYVSMLATVLSDRKTAVPLSVGIFGDWGSGKSFFMGLLREQVDTIAATGNPDYCSQVAQISFNAWHYADTNIWASLGDEIFRQLLGSDPSAEDRRRELRDELAQRLDQRRKIEQMAERARGAAAHMQAAVDRAAGVRETRIRELLGALRRSPELARRTKALWRSLGVGDEVEKTRLLADQLQGALSEAEALRRSPADRAGKLALAAAAIVLAAYAAASEAAPGIRTWMAAYVGGFLTLVGTTGVLLLTRARAGVRALRSLAEDIRTGLDESRRAAGTHEIAEALTALHHAEAAQRVAEAQLSDVMERIGELGWQLGELEPGRRLYSFLADRAGSETYMRNLGLISMIRKDFEQLVSLLADARAHPHPSDLGETDRWQPLERIILYIDDLDRCSPRQVVDVLQAVHLLLALDLFVVVIGVDSRWLLRSLSSHYADILAEEPGALGDLPGPATSADYLEKIINIPVSLPRMPRSALGQMASALIAAEALTGAPARPGSARHEPVDPSQESVVSSGSFVIEEGSEVARQRTQAGAVPLRPLTMSELSLLGELDEFVETPREAKRLINLYRMLRATRDLSDASQFLGEDGGPAEYKAVAVLLAVLNFRPRLLEPFLDAQPDAELNIRGGLMHRPRDTEWMKFVADLQPRQGYNGVAGAIHEDSLAAWNRLHGALTRVSAQINRSDLSTFQLWAPRVRRFSYTETFHGQATAGK